MCGIAGLFRRDSLTPKDWERLAKLQHRLRHRGPDGMGEFVHDRFGLASTRLAIVDPTSSSAPLASEDGRFLLVANGEIYNHLELRRELEAKGHRFATRCDTEVILHLFEERGADAIHALHGMFAFAIVDTRRHLLWLARDRMGEKPIFFHPGDDHLIFASEMKALAPDCRFELDAQAVDWFFHYQFVPEPSTVMRGVEKLPAGHFLQLDWDAWTWTIERYWQPQDAVPLDANPVETIRAALEASVEHITQGDAPIGLALSGGLDSSAVAALVQHRHPGLVEAFAVGYPGFPPNDERREAEAFACRLKMPIHCVEVASEAIIAEFADLVWNRDEPNADISGSAYEAVFRKASELGKKVMLLGHGGDELFWGYPWVTQALEVNLRRRRPSSIQDQYQKWLGKKTSQIAYYDQHPDFQAARAFRQLGYTTRFRRALETTAPPEAFFADGVLSDALPAEFPRWAIAGYLRENGIAQSDRLAMAHGVEVRLPLCDARLVDTVFGLRKIFSDHRLPAKAWLREAVRPLLPAEVLNRPKKGFTPPVFDWLAGILDAWGHLLNDGYLTQTGWLRPGLGRLETTPDFPRALCRFKALVLEIWCRRMQGERPTHRKAESQVFHLGQTRVEPAPIALFAYRRPDHLRRTLDSLAKNPEAAKSQCVLFSDGPRDEADESAVREVRRIAREVRHFSFLEIVERPSNLGLAQSVITGVDDLLVGHDRVIVLEDDLELSPGFLDYMNRALDRYRDDEAVMQIAGYQYPVVSARAPGFLPFIGSWGWATWSRAWRHFDPNMGEYPKLVNNWPLQYAFDLENSYPFLDMLIRQRNLELDSWAIRWYLAVFMRKGLALYPPRSLVRNLGMDGTGVHCEATTAFDVDLADAMRGELPKRLAVDTRMLAEIQAYFRKLYPRPRRPLWRRALGRLRRLVTDDLKIPLPGYPVTRQQP